MYKRIFSSSIVFPLLIVCFPGSLLVLSICLFVLVRINNFESKLLAISALIFYVPSCVICIIALNRDACFITLKENTLNRRGFFCGFHLKMPIEDIYSIDSVSLSLGFRPIGDYYAVNDRKHLTDEKYSKKSTIFIPKNDKGIEFIKCFMNDNIKTNCKELKDDAKSRTIS